MELHLTKPGLFITATDTEVGKTFVTCAIAAALRGKGLRVGVCKPIATGCREENSELVSDDAVALKAAAASPLPLDVINPVRYREPLAPAVAAQREGRAVDDRLIAAALHRIDGGCDFTLVEGIGGVMVPLDDHRNVTDLAAEIGYPVVVVTRPDLGTLNHTALTVAALRQRGLRIAGLVINSAAPAADANDVARQTNPAWLTKLTGLPVLAQLPHCPAAAPAAPPPPIMRAIAAADWASLGLSPARR